MPARPSFHTESRALCPDTPAYTRNFYRPNTFHFLQRHLPPGNAQSSSLLSQEQARWLDLDRPVHGQDNPGIPSESAGCWSDTDSSVSVDSSHPHIRELVQEYHPNREPQQQIAVVASKP